MSFKIGDPVIFEAQNRLVPWGSLGIVTNIKTQQDGTWVTAKFDDKEYSMKQGDCVFKLDLDEIRKERDALRAELDEAKKNIANARLELEWPVVKENQQLRAALEQIELNTRNASVVGHPGITCRECEETNLACSEALNKKD